MNSKKLLSLLLTVGIASAAIPVCVYAVSRIDMDYNSDEVVDVFDMISARQKSASKDELERLSSFLHGQYKAPETSEGYTLVWSDEFDGNALDTDKWSYELGNWKLDENGNYVTNGWGNNEQEFYTDKNTTVSDGVLTIAARKENYTDPVQGNYEYTSSRLSTQHKFSTCGGRIEVRAKCDSGKSLWPAIWMLPEDSVYGGWAASGEIDIMEGWGSTPDKICGTIHFGDVWPNNTYLTNDYIFKNGDSTESWHTYSIEWDKDEMRWYVDDDLYSTQKDWFTVDRPYPAPFDQNFYIILNLAVGGHFDGIDGIYAEPATFADGEKHFDIDYVKVYSRNGNDFAPTPVSSMALGSYIEGADAYVANKDGCTLVHIDSVGSLEYGVMALLRGQKVQAGDTWQLEFDAASTAEREMIVTAEDSSYTRYLDEKSLSPLRKNTSATMWILQPICRRI
ncbi:MAG: glycoside hydrolase family 16 protein [Ruminococcus sp.]|nr:glycoside hydrolase family 16 protein [Ruminococcus sp.]